VGAEPANFTDDDIFEILQMRLLTNSTTRRHFPEQCATQRELARCPIKH